MKRRYRLLYNHDGGAMVAPFQPFFDLPFSIDNFVARTVGHLEETHVDAVTWTLGTDNQRIARATGPGTACQQVTSGRSAARSSAASIPTPADSTR